MILLKQEGNYLDLRRITLSIIVIAIFSLIGASWLLALLSLFYFSLLSSILFLFYVLKLLHMAAAYKHFSYAIDEDGIYINKGVFWRRKIVISRNRVQHTDVQQGPFERKYTIATLVINTAGTRNATVRVSGILREKAEELRASLRFEEGNDGV